MWHVLFDKHGLSKSIISIVNKSKFVSGLSTSIRTEALHLQRREDQRRYLSLDCFFWLSFLWISNLILAMPHQTPVIRGHILPNILTTSALIVCFTIFSAKIKWSLLYRQRPWIQQRAVASSSSFPDINMMPGFETPNESVLQAYEMSCLSLYIKSKLIKLSNSPSRGFETVTQWRMMYMALWRPMCHWCSTPTSTPIPMPHPPSHIPHHNPSLIWFVHQ